MKKLTTISFLALLVFLSVSSCTKPKDEAPQPPPTELKWQDLKPEVVNNDGTVTEIPFD